MFPSNPSVHTPLNKSPSQPLNDLSSHPARHLAGDALAQALRDCRARTWSLVDDLSDAQWLPPLQHGVNPIGWELAHLAWFAEFWILRGPHHRNAEGRAMAQQAAQFTGPDAHMDSSRLPHDQRWAILLPTRPQLRQTLADQLEACLHALPRGPFASQAHSDEALYFHRLALFHEDMHAEALCWLRSALAYAAPLEMPAPPSLSADSNRGFGASGSPQIRVPGGQLELGFRHDAPGFAFDNERPGQTLAVADFTIDARAVTAEAFAQFIDAGGYAKPQHWSPAGDAWRRAAGQRFPANWRYNASLGWQFRWFDQWTSVQTRALAINLNAFEAEAYCHWAQRRLPTAAEWELAAQTQPQFSWGHSVWEWTADGFAPYEGFAPGPYNEYSQPWFGNHREVRGGAFATHARMHHPRYRNFFLPERSDTFVGFRTVALS